MLSQGRKATDHKASKSEQGGQQKDLGSCLGESFFTVCKRTHVFRPAPHTNSLGAVFSECELPSESENHFNVCSPGHTLEVNALSGTLNIGAGFSALLGHGAWREVGFFHFTDFGSKRQCPVILDEGVEALSVYPVG
jgi:hypothetical protein